MCSFSKAILDLSYPFDQSCRTISQSSPHWAANIFIKALRKGSSLSMLFTQRLRPCELFFMQAKFFSVHHRFRRLSRPDVPRVGNQAWSARPRCQRFTASVALVAVQQRRAEAVIAHPCGCSDRHLYWLI